MTEESYFNSVFEDNKDSFIGFLDRLVNSPNAIVSWLIHNISSLEFLSWNKINPIV